MEVNCFEILLINVTFYFNEVSVVYARARMASRAREMASGAPALIGLVTTLHKLVEKLP